MSRIASSQPTIIWHTASRAATRQPTSRAADHAVSSGATTRIVEAATTNCSRPRRVSIILAGVVILSLIDLALTLWHLQTMGMWEANPLARFIIRSTESSWALGSFKLLTLMIGVGIQYRLRRTQVVEVSAWCSLVILSAVTVQWRLYCDCIAQHPPQSHADMFKGSLHADSLVRLPAAPERAMCTR